MATIALYSDRISCMPDLIKGFKESVKGFNKELASLKTKCSKVETGICNLEEVISLVSTSTQTQEEVIDSLDAFETQLDEFVSESDKIDADVADTVNKGKKDFYDSYSYLKPDCEKGGWEKFCDGCKSVAAWCKDNWGAICNIVLVVIAVTAIVALSIITFGAVAVFVAAAVGCVIGLAGQLIGDVISFFMTGEWSGTWSGYISSALGGAIGGILSLSGNAVLACGVDSAISTLFGQSCENLIGREKRSFSEIWLNTAASSASSMLLSGLFGRVNQKLSKSLSKSIPALRRFSGRGSYEAAFNMVLTKLKNKTIKKITIKTMRNGIVSGLAGDFIKNICSGFGLISFIEDGIKNTFTPAEA